MKAVTIEGGFHNAKPITLRLRDNRQMSPYQANRVRKHMCGIPSCACWVQHGWVVDGISLAELEDALINAEISANRI